MKVDENRIYLEDIGEIVMSRGGRDIWLIKGITRHEAFRGRCLPERIYAVDFPGRGVGEEFLLSRQACGAEKFLMIKEIGHDMMRLFERMFDGKLAQFVILWGGRPLDLLDANPPLHRSRLLDTTYIKLTRVEDNAVSRGWNIVESSFVGEWWQDETWIIMEECIASGSTLTYFVEEALKHHRPRKIFLFPVCASLEGLEGICRICIDQGVELIPVFNGALIQVAEKGVTLPFTDLGLQPLTIVTQHFYNDLKERYQNKPLCWVGDIGDSIYKPEDHLIETLCDMLAVGMDFEREDFSLWSPIVRSHGFLARMEKSHQEVFKAVAGYLKPS
ncbi:MAG: hypothetical protein JRH12_17840 [Deltaproteobacteria bacterium]|jgi:hypothetical protein|nr:hypothetical protein [Deltaproteobacteria bacterium]